MVEVRNIKTYKITNAPMNNQHFFTYSLHRGRVDEEHEVAGGEGDDVPHEVEDAGPSSFIDANGIKS